MSQQHQKTLPTEILEKIFEELSAEDLLTCQSICHSWHIPAKRDFYKHVEFKTSISINLFLSCISRKSEAFASTTIPPPGTFVKRLFFNHAPTTSIMQNFSVGSTLSAKHIQALASQCPNVTIVDCTQNLNSLVVMGLLSLDDNLTWKGLTSFPDSRISQQLYRQCSYKFRQSLSTFYYDMEAIDFIYLREFPSLKILDLSSAPISSINELNYILDSCKQLAQLVLTIKQSSKTAKNFQSSHVSVYPSLKLLKVRTDDDEFDHSFFRYIMEKFSRLLSVEVCGVDILGVSLKDRLEYLRIIRWMNSLKSSELVLLGHDYNTVPQVATEYLSGIFKTQLQTVEYNTTLSIHNANHEMTNSSNTTFLVFSSMSINPSWVQRDIDIQLPDFETNNRQVHSDYINQFSAYVNEIFISYEGTPIYTRGCSYFLDSIIEQCSVLRSISVNYCDLSLSTDFINEAITEFSVSNSQIAIDFFNTLSFCCPNLKHLTLHRNFHSRSDEHTIFICMPHSELEVLSLLGEVHFPWISIQDGSDNSMANWIIKISTTSNNSERYFKLDTFSSSVTELFQGKQASTRIISSRVSGGHNSISIGINCKALKKFRISTSFADTTLDL